MRKALLKRKILNTGALWISYVKLVPDLLKLNKKSLVLDCGANVGHITKLLASTGASVIAFEPDPVAFEKLKKRCGDLRKVTLIQKGVWDKAATIPLYTHKDSKGDEASFTVGSSIVADKVNINPGVMQEIEVIDLVQFLEQLPKKPDLIKLDVEGAEIEIVEHIIETKSWNLFDRMYVETHETKIPEHKEKWVRIREQLKSNGVTNIKLNWI